MKLRIQAAFVEPLVFCEAVFDKKVEVEGVTAKRTESLEDAFAIYGQGQIPVMIDENGSMIQEVQPPVVVDAILAKRILERR